MPGLEALHDPHFHLSKTSQTMPPRLTSLCSFANASMRCRMAIKSVPQPRSTSLSLSDAPHLKLTIKAKMLK